jgi:O-6-methylguanine DNA methyltransferase
MVEKAQILHPLYTGIIKNTPLGNIRLAVSKKGLAAVSWIKKEADFHQFLTKRFKLPVESKPDEIEWPGEEINKYLRGSLMNFSIPIDWSIFRPFQMKVLLTTFAIPYGETRYYSEIAADINRPKAARAVGRAEATNPMPLVIPCHRVIGCDGKLRGYGGGKGLPTKAWLLKLEGAVIA